MGIALVTALVLAMLLAVAVGTLVGTEAGTSWLLKKSARWTDGALKVGVHHGTLASGLSVESVSWMRDQLLVALDQVEIKISWLDLLDGALTVESISAGSALVHWQSGASSATTPPSLPESPIPISVLRLAAQNVRLQSGDSDPITFDGMALVARWDSEGLDFRSIDIDSRFGRLEGAVSVDGSAAHDLSGRFQVRALLPDLPDLQAELVLSGELANPVLDLEIEAPYTADLVVKYSHLGPYSVAGPVSISLSEVNTSWPQIHLMGEVEGVGRGIEMAYRTQLMGNWEGQPLTPIPLSIAGRIWPAGTTIEALSIERGTERLSGKGAIEWGGGTTARFELSIEKVSPASWWTVWPDALPAIVNGTVEATLSAPGAGTAFGLEVAQLDLDGHLRDRAFRLSGLGRIEGDVWNINEFTAQYGSSLIEISASNQQTFDLVATLEAPDMGEWMDEAAGRASVRLNLKGDIVDPLVRMTMSAKDFGWGGRSVENLALTAVGSLSRHQVSMEVLQSEFPLAAAWTGALEHTGTRPTGYQADLTNLNLQVPGLVDQDKWTLETADDTEVPKALPRVQWQPDQITVQKSCLVSAKSRLCLDGKWQAQGGAGNLSLQHFPLQGLIAPLSKDYVLEGTADLSSHWRFDPGAKVQWQPDFKLSTSSILVSAQNVKAESSAADGAEPGTDEVVFEPFRVAPIQLTLTSADSGPWRFDLQQPDDPMGGFTGDATLSIDTKDWLASQISGSVKAVLPDVAFLESVLAYATDLKGEVSGEVILAGTLGNPDLEGLLQWSNGQFRLPEQGLSWTNVSLEVVSPALKDSVLRRVEVRGQGTSGDGTLVLTGAVDWTGDIKTSDGEGRLTGEAVRMLNTDLAQIQASPDVELRLEQGMVTLAGEVLIPWARVRIRERPISAVTVSEDQRIGGSTVTAPRKTAYLVNADVNLRFGEDVKFTGFGLDTTLGGGIALRQRGQLTTANGSIVTSEGTYAAYGQKLVVNRGRLLWSDTPLLKPAIDVDASRTPSKEVTVGLRASGAIDRPEVRLYSVPGMTQSEQLSWLLFGRPLQTTSSAETSVMNEAALALGVRAGDFLTKRLGGGLGLDQVGIEVPAGEGNETAALVLGKYLTPDLYVSYGISLLEALSTLRIEYALSQDWRVVTESSAERNSADVFFVKERQ